MKETGIEICLEEEKLQKDIDLENAVLYVANEGAEYGSQIELIISCSNLPNMDMFSLTDPMVVFYLKNIDTEEWTEQGRTEMIKDCLNPLFLKSFNLPYTFEQKQHLKFEVYDMDDHSEHAILAEQDFIGEAYFELHEILAQKNDQTMTKKILDKNKVKLSKDSTITVRAEEIAQNNNNIKMNIGGKELDSSYQVFFKIYRYRDSGDWLEVFCSEKVQNNRIDIVKWPQFEINTTNLCRANEDKEIKFEVYEIKRLFGKHNLLGSCEVTLNEIKSEKKEVKLYMKRMYMGTLIFLNTDYVIHYSFLDYVFGGCRLNLMIAIDFTYSNLQPDNPKSLHHLNKKGSNEYVQAIKGVGEILQYYDQHSGIGLFGFGAKIPPFYEVVSHCFALNGNIYSPEIKSLQEVISLYKATLSNVTLHGPSVFSQIIRLIRQIATHNPVTQENQEYYLLLIITDGEVNDFETTKFEIVEASSLPISIIIVGVGQGDFNQMNILDGDEERLFSKKANKHTSRDIVQFVPFSDFKGNRQKLAKETLREIPEQFLSFMKLNDIKPKNYDILLDALQKNSKKEKKSKHAKKEEYKRQNIYLDKQKQVFCKELTEIGFEEPAVKEMLEEGLRAMDKDLAIQILNNFSYQPKVSLSQKSEKKKKRNKYLPEFAYELPMLAPQGFVPGKADKKKCKICYENKYNTVILPCKHRVTCEFCKKFLKQICPLCERKIDKIIKIYKRDIAMN